LLGVTQVVEVLWGIENMSAEHFAARLKELREQAGLTQQQLADRVGMSRFGIAQFEQGRNKPSLESAVALAEALGVECTAFLEAPTSITEPKMGRPSRADREQRRGKTTVKKPARSQRKKK
jgi:transcriptional regulator with XRE-family HTH domain